MSNSCHCHRYSCRCGGCGRGDQELKLWRSGKRKSTAVEAWDGHALLYRHRRNTLISYNTTLWLATIRVKGCGFGDIILLETSALLGIFEPWIYQKTAATVLIHLPALFRVDGIYALVFFWKPLNGYNTLSCFRSHCSRPTHQDLFLLLGEL